MASDKGVPLPKFGEWDVKNPASAADFTVIFKRARDEKKGVATPVMPPRRNTSNTKSRKQEVHHHHHHHHHHHLHFKMRKWLCCD